LVPNVKKLGERQGEHASALHDSSTDNGIRGTWFGEGKTKKPLGSNIRK